MVLKPTKVTNKALTNASVAFSTATARFVRSLTPFARYRRYEVTPISSNSVSSAVMAVSRAAPGDHSGAGAEVVLAVPQV